LRRFAVSKDWIMMWCAGSSKPFRYSVLSSGSSRDNPIDAKYDGFLVSG
jgi:hypothetical protein